MFWQSRAQPRLLDLRDLRRWRYRRVIRAIHRILGTEACQSDSACIGRGGAYIQGTKHWEYPFALEHADLRRGLTILDAGCGQGGLHLYLDRMGFAVTALDLEPPRHFAQVFGSRVRYVEADLQAPLPLDGRFDRIFCICVLEHVPDYRAAVRNLAVALKPGGRLIVTVEYHEREEQFSPATLGRLWEGTDLLPPPPVPPVADWPAEYRRARYFRDLTHDVTVLGMVLRKRAR